MLLRPPPEDEWPREKLLRLFLVTPRPILPIDIRHPEAPDVQLYARSLTGTEHRMCIDYADDCPVDDMRFGLRITALTAAALWTDRGPAFSGPGHMSSAWSSRTISLFGGQVLSKLRIISPYYADCDFTSWQDAFRVGGQHPSNFNAALSLGQCVTDYSSEPEKFFGVQRHELTDGQWMAFHGARAMVDEMREQNRKRKRR